MEKINNRSDFNILLNNLEKLSLGFKKNRERKIEKSILQNLRMITDKALENALHVNVDEEQREQGFFESLKNKVAQIFVMNENYDSSNCSIDSIMSAQKCLDEKLLNLKIS